MRKSVYIICVCVLMVLVFYEAGRGKKKKNGGVYVPAARLMSQLEKENKQEEKGKKVAYLTFDDGPSYNTEKILDILKEKKAVSSFFIIGKDISEEKEKIIKRALEQGNAVGVHTYCHEQCNIYKDKEHFFSDYDKADKVLENILGKKPTLHRFPWGSNNGFVSSFVDSLIEELQRRGVRSFDWNVSGEDSVGADVPEQTIFANVKRDLTRYDKPIILLHDSAAMNHTTAVLPQIIDYIREQGYEFDTLENHSGYLFPASWR